MIFKKILHNLPDAGGRGALFAPSAAQRCVPCNFLALHDILISISQLNKLHNANTGSLHELFRDANSARINMSCVLKAISLGYTYFKKNYPNMFPILSLYIFTLLPLSLVYPLQSYLDCKYINTAVFSPFPFRTPPTSSISL